PPITRTSCWDVYLKLLDCFHNLDDMYSIPAAIDAKWGYALTLARDDYAREIELLPNLRPLRNGDAVIGTNGSYYMGGVNNGDGLDTDQLARLDQMLEEDEPSVTGGSEANNNDSDQIFVWFSDEEFVDGSDGVRLPNSINGLNFPDLKPAGSYPPDPFPVWMGSSRSGNALSVQIKLSTAYENDEETVVGIGGVSPKSPRFASASFTAHKDPGGMDKSGLVPILQSDVETAPRSDRQLDQYGLNHLLGAKAEHIVEAARQHQFSAGIQESCEIIDGATTFSFAHTQVDPNTWT
ncbi:hypothetical protein K438DRAFT_1781553, partial [Mycena galopus ATCC 62051]